MGTSFIAIRIIYPSEWVRSCEGLYEIYPQNLKNEEKKKRNTKNKKNKTQYIHARRTVHISINHITLVTQVSVYKQASYTFQVSSCPQMIYKHQPFNPQRVKTLNPSMCPVCKCIIILGVRLTRINSIPLDQHQPVY